MNKALLYQSRAKWRFGAALSAAAVIHLAVISFANIRRTDMAVPSSASWDPPVIDIVAYPPDPDPPVDLSAPLSTPPPMDQSFQEVRTTPLPVRRQITKFTPIVRSGKNTIPGPSSPSSAKVFAISAPRPEYPYEARRQKITGDGVVLIRIDPVTGNVIGVFMVKATGSQFLDNAAIAGFKRWRFKPGTVSPVTCPVTFTLTGASY